MSPAPKQIAPIRDEVLYVQVAPGKIEYLDSRGNNQTIVFQCNPTSLTRSRSITRQDTRAGNTTEATTTRPGMAGRKYTHKPTPWKIESLELWFDASLPYSSSGNVRAEGMPHRDNLSAISEALEHLEAISEPVQASNENESQEGAPPAPSPPKVALTLGRRRWEGYVNSISILEKDFTPDLVPKQLKVTLGLEMVLTRSDYELRKTGGKK
jgi:hypothetical protein